MAIDVLLDGDALQIDEEVFKTLLDNSVAGTYVDYEKTLASGSIKFAKLLWLARKGEIPYPLFFAPLSLVKAQVDAKTQKLLAGVSKDTFQIGTREKVELRDVELLIKDLIRKQEMLKKYDGSLEKNKIVGLLRKPSASPQADADRLMSAIGLTHGELRRCKKKEDALALIIARLEANQILVAQSVQRYMPQRLVGPVTFSGMTIRDSKVPYVFLAGGDHGDKQEPFGRRVFTLALMTVLIARKVFKAVTWNSQSVSTDLGYEYDVAGAMLMPSTLMRELDLSTLGGVKTAAEEFKVTPSAVTVRAMKLGLVSGENTQRFLCELREEFDSIPKRKGGNNIYPWNAVRKYAGRELSRRMFLVMESGAIPPKEYCRVVCFNKLKPNQLAELKQVVM